MLKLGRILRTTYLGCVKCKLELMSNVMPSICLSKHLLHQASLVR